MSRLKADLMQACKELGLNIQLDYRLPFDDGVVVAIARIENIGAPKGMLIFGSCDEMNHHGEDVIGAGYGYSVMDEPATTEAYDLQAYKEIFIDWGWSEGDVNNKK